MSHEPIAYTYEADHHCPGCTLTRFGRAADGFIAGENADGAFPTDSEGNEVGVIAPWDEWWDASDECERHILTCGTCHGEIDRIDPTGA